MQQHFEMLIVLLLFFRVFDKYIVQAHIWGILPVIIGLKKNV